LIKLVSNINIIGIHDRKAPNVYKVFLIKEFEIYIGFY